MDLTNQSDASILAVATPLMDNLMAASAAIDYARHIQDFTDRLKRCLTEEQLKRICADYKSLKGDFTDREFVAIFRRPDSVAIIWRQRFTKQRGDYVAEMVLVQSDGRYLVDHVMVF